MKRIFNKKNSGFLTAFICLNLFIFSFLLSVALGSVKIPIKDILRLIIGKILDKDIPEISESASIILFNVRLPRTLLSALVGASLSAAGAAMQGILKTPLADGGILGVSSGASLGAVIAIISGISGLFYYSLVSLFSIIFAFLSIIIVLTITKIIDKSMSNNTLILTGVVFSMLAGSLVSLIISLSGDHLRKIVFWSMGSLAGRGWSYVLLITPFAVISLPLILSFSKELNAFALGEDEARYIGVNVKKVKLILFIVISVLIGVSVSVSGVISFVGLIIPHIARRLTGPKFERLLPVTIFLGASFLMLADLISRTIISPAELPVGIVTSLFGSIVFILIFINERRQNI